MNKKTKKKKPAMLYRSLTEFYLNFFLPLELPSWESTSPPYKTGGREY